MGEAETMLRETQQSLDHLGAPPPEGTRARRTILRESAGRVARLVRDACKGSYDGVLADESNLRIFARFSQATARFHPGPFVGVYQSQFFRDVVNIWR